MNPVIHDDPRRQSEIICDGRTGCHLLALDRARGLRIFWARRAVQMCIGPDARLISTIVVEQRIGGTHLADFIAVLRHARRASTLSCTDGDGNRN
jgi:hypothetical protein